MFRAKVRGIYSTALGKLLMEAGFKIVEASRPLASRLRIEQLNEPPDLTAVDLKSRWGVLLVGRCDAFDAAVEALRRVDPILIKSRQRLHEVFAATPRVQGGKAVVELEGDLLRIPERYVVYPSRRLFTVVKPAFRRGEGVAIPDIILDGRYVELTPSGRVSFGGRVDPQERTRLTILAEKVRMKYGGIGLKFLSSARYGRDEEIEAEVAHLFKRLVEISSGPHGEGERVQEGRCTAIALFDGESKRMLDRIRASVAPTAEGHHMLKAQGASECVDIVDRLQINVYKDGTKILKDNLEIIHIIPWGNVIKMKGDIVKVLDDLVIVRRALKPGGSLEGIGKRIEEGDYALTCIPLNRNYVVHTYYSSEGKEKGTYININTIPEIGIKIGYIDLVIDKVIADGNEATLDVEEYRELAPSLPGRIREAAESALGLRIRCSPNGLEAEASGNFGFG